LIEQKVIQERIKGNNRYEIHAILTPQLKKHTPSPSGIYNILKRENLNRLKPVMKLNKRKIIKEKAGELGHIDCHYLSKDLIVNDSKRYYLVCVIDDYSRIAWAEVVDNIKSLTVMFASLKSLNLIHAEYKIQFEEVITDNGSEFSGRKNIENHPFERMLVELGIKHRYTRPYRPQTNGKVERFWRTLNEDLIEGTTFDSLDNFKDELMQYLLYYNNVRGHQGINGQPPKLFLETAL
jgi:transposase InsO family protein